MAPSMDRHGGVLEAGLIDRAVEFVGRNTPVMAALDGGSPRVERPTHPDEVVREAAANTLIHTNYVLANSDVELAVHANRLEVDSPGRLPDGITPERMRAGVRATRNQLPMHAMRDYGYLEHMGMGVPRKIVRGVKEHNATDPDLVEEGEHFIVRLFAGKWLTLKLIHFGPTFGRAWDLLAHTSRISKECRTQGQSLPAPGG